MSDSSVGAPSEETALFAIPQAELTDEEALRQQAERIYGLACDAFNLLIDQNRKARKHREKEEYGEMYRELPTISDIYAGIEVFMGNLGAAAAVDQAIHDTSPTSLRDISYQRALVTRGDKEAHRKLWNVLPVLDDEETRQLLIELALSGDEKALSQLGDDILSDPALVHSLVDGGLTQEVLQKLLPDPLDRQSGGLTEFIQSFRREHRNNIYIHGGETFEDVGTYLLLGYDLAQLVGHAHPDIRYSDITSEEYQILLDDSFKRIRVYRAAALLGQVENKWINQFLFEEQNLQQSLDRSAGMDGIELAMPQEFDENLAIATTYGVGFSDVLDGYNDLDAADKQFYAEKMFEAAIACREYDIAESLIPVFEAPSDRMKVCYILLTNMARCGQALPINSLPLEAPTIEPKEFMNVADRVLLSKIYANVEIARLDVSSDLVEARRMAEAIANPAMQKKAFEAVEEKQASLDVNRFDI